MYEAKQKMQKVTFFGFWKTFKNVTVINWAYWPKYLGLKTTLNQICCHLYNY